MSSYDIVCVADFAFDLQKVLNNLYILCSTFGIDVKLQQQKF